MSEQSEKATLQSRNRRVLNKDFAQYLTNKISESGMTQAHISRVSGISRVTVNNWCNGVAKPSADNVVKLANIIGVSAHELMSGKDEDLFKGFNREIIEDAARIIRRIESAQCKLYSEEKFSEKLVDICCRLANGDSIPELEEAVTAKKEMTQKAHEMAKKKIERVKAESEFPIQPGKEIDLYMSYVGEAIVELARQ